MTNTTALSPLGFIYSQNQSPLEIESRHLKIQALAYSKSEDRSEDIDDSLYLVTLKQKAYENISTIHKECQNEGWDGYDASPISEENAKYAREIIDFLSSLYPTKVMKLIDIIPENDGNFCFEWFKSNDKFISVSIKKNRLIFNYKNKEKKSCGETNFADKNSIIQKIKEIV